MAKTPDFVMTKTPLRVSFVGGGTDLLDYYQNDYGAVVSTAINKYIYVTVKRHGHLFQENYRLNYSETENVSQLDQIRNKIARECLRFLKVDAPIYISTIADVPALSGLGSSSTFAVGLLNALHAFRGERVSAGQLAEEASHIEIDVLKEPIGKQDQYAAAFGGLNYLRFKADGRVSIEPQHRHDSFVDRLFSQVMMFWTELQRDASSVLKQQKSATASKMEHLNSMRAQADELRVMLQKEISIDDFGRMLDKGWRLKRSLTGSISNSALDDYYERALKAGATGGKLCGAGGGGFLLFVVPESAQASVREAMAPLKELPVRAEMHGSRIVFME